MIYCVIFRILFFDPWESMSVWKNIDMSKVEVKGGMEHFLS
jgi:hypothetical protein